MKRALLLALVFTVGAVLAVTARVYLIWREDQRVESVVHDTITYNPRRGANAAVIEADVERGFGAPLVASPRDREPSLREGASSADLETIDPEWATLPRSHFAIESTTESLAGLDAKSLFRNAHLNGSDVYIGKEQRAVFDAWLRRSVARLCEIRATVTSVANQEFQFMLDRNTAHTLSYSDYLGKLDAEGLAKVEREAASMRKDLETMGLPKDAIDRSIADMMTFEARLLGDVFTHGTRDGHIVWAELKEMPQTSQAAALFHAGVLDMYCQLLEFFARHAGLGELESNRALESITARLARYVVK